jgi:oligoribonuclease NrnB/cAMP/cGMP phosphodiesterase (DHH superfamily)
MNPIVILYHADCPDGFGAAWAAWKKFGKKAEYIPIQASQTEEQLRDIKLKNREVYFLDVCASVSKLRELKKNNESVMVIDHHVTSKENAKEANSCLFDLKHSGSVLSWTYFHLRKPVPWLLRYVEDADLWKYKLPNPDEISVRLFLLNFNFSVWDKLAKDFESRSFRDKYAEEGKLILEYENQVINGILKNSYEVVFKGYSARVVNTSVSHSTVGNLLIDERHPIGITWYEIGETRKYSLRSKGETNVSKLAKRFPGGGGHKHAAGFTLPANEPFPWKIIKNEK